MNNSVFSNVGHYRMVIQKSIIMVHILLASTASCNNIIYNYGCKRTANHMFAPLTFAFTFSDRIAIPRRRTRTYYKLSPQRNDKRKIQSQFFVSLRMKSDDSKSSIPSSVSLSESTLTTTTTTTSTTSTTSTVSMTLQNAITTLEQYNVSEPIMSTVHLLAMALQLPWETGYYHLLQIVNYHNDNTNNNENTNNINPHESLSNRILTTEELDDFNILVQRRIHHEPIQYICGQWDFCDNIIKIRQPLLCPRPETEELVVYAIQDIKTILKEKITRLITETKQGDNDNAKIVRVLDIGCGTGCIGITIAKQIPETYVTAIDIEPIAIVTSNENAHRLQVQNRYQVHLCNIENFDTEFIKTKQLMHDASLLYDMVVSNPPYILPSDMTTLELSVYNYESHAALNGGDSDGMKVIRTIIRTLPNICNINAICWLEVDPSQPTLIKEFCREQRQHLEQKQQQLYHNAKPYDDDDINNPNTKVVQYVECIKDMFGLDRYVKLRIMELYHNV